MSAEDHEVEQDLYLRGLSKAKEDELLTAVHCLTRRIHRQRRLLMVSTIGSILGLLITVLIAFMVYGL